MGYILSNLRLPDDHLHPFNCFPPISPEIVTGKTSGALKSFVRARQVYKEKLQVLGFFAAFITGPKSFGRR